MEFDDFVYYVENSAEKWKIKNKINKCAKCGRSRLIVAYNIDRTSCDLRVLNENERNVSCVEDANDKISISAVTAACLIAYAF